MIGLNDVLCARERIAPHILRTPLLRVPALDDPLGCRVYLKLEGCQITGSFKLRGALNCLAALEAAVGLDNVLRIVRVTGYVNSTPDFLDQSRVINGASDLLGALFGEQGRHARSAVGVNVLPGDAACEVELIAQVRR